MQFLISNNTLKSWTQLEADVRNICIKCKKPKMLQ